MAWLYPLRMLVLILPSPMPLLPRAAGEWDTRTTLDADVSAPPALPASESHAARLVTGYQCVGQRPDLWTHVGDIMQTSRAFTTPGTPLAAAAMHVKHAGGLLPVVDQDGHVRSLRMIMRLGWLAVVAAAHALRDEMHRWLARAALTAGPLLPHSACPRSAQLVGLLSQRDCRKPGECVADVMADPLAVQEGEAIRAAAELLLEVRNGRSLAPLCCCSVQLGACMSCMAKLQA